MITVPEVEDGCPQDLVDPLVHKIIEKSEEVTSYSNYNRYLTDPKFHTND